MCNIYPVNGGLFNEIILLRAPGQEVGRGLSICLRCEGRTRRLPAAGAALCGGRTRCTGAGGRRSRWGGGPLTRGG